MTGIKSISLSFDNGPDPEVTPHVLDVLERTGVRGSFFVVGDKLRDRRYLCERAHDEGHWIGNHTFNHLVPLGLSESPGAAEREINRTQRLLGDLAHKEKWFRPFGGGGLLDDRLLDQESFDCLVEEHFSCVLWNAVPRDWADPFGWPETALIQCSARDHSLLVLHDLPTDAMAQLESFIDRARVAGFRFVQEFPESCVPVRGGKVVASMAPYVKQAPSKQSEASM